MRVNLKLGEPTARRDYQAQKLGAILVTTPHAGTSFIIGGSEL